MIFAFALAFPRAASAAPEAQVYPNVFLVADAGAKSVKVWLVVKAGFRDETDAEPGGVAHYLEHLFIVGRGGDRKDSSPLLFANADANAFTTYDSTAYWHKFLYKPETADADLETAFRFFCDRIAALDVSADEARRERDVVMQEYDWRISSSPQTAFNDANNKLLQPGHPLGRPGIGTKDSIRAYTLEDARKFHDRLYAKNNVAFVVHGPVDPAKLKALAEKYLAPLPEKPIAGHESLDALLHLEPMDALNEASDAKVKTKLVRLEKTVPAKLGERRVADASGDVATAYMNSRLEGSAYDELVDRLELARSVEISRSPIGGGAVWLTFDAEPEEGVTPATLRAAMEDYLSKLAKRGMDAAVVDRLKARAIGRLAEIADDKDGAASALAFHFAADGTYDEWQRRAEVFAEVSPKSIQPMLDALAGPGRELLGVLSPASAAN